MKRILAGSALVLSVVLPAVVLGTVGSAHAVSWSAGGAAAKAAKTVRVQPVVTLPAKVVVSKSTLTLTGSVSGVTATTATSLSLWFTYPNSTTAVKIGGVSADSQGMLTVTAQLNAARIAMGLNTIQVRDAAGSSATSAQTGAGSATFDVRRRSRIRITQVVFRPTASGFAAAAAIKVMHFDPKSAQYIDSRLSPVRLQELVNGGWVTRAEVTTNVHGVATATFAATAGRHTYRAVRPNGATVWSAVSTETTVRTPAQT